MDRALVARRTDSGFVDSLLDSRLYLIVGPVRSASPVTVHNNTDAARADEARAASVLFNRQTNVVRISAADSVRGASRRVFDRRASHD